MTPNDWYKDAIIYEAHVKAFRDSNGDGTGDFRGLTEKLDYLQDLGINCIWLLPFFPSPLRDDGYDIADYLAVNPDYGTVEDLERFLSEAHQRGIRVLADLVVNHTSDQHPWFQEERQLLATNNSKLKTQNSKLRYVWSDTGEEYRGARIIFTDTESSNWTFDPIAGKYFWHRFFSHQPDLNYDNPEVQREMLDIMRFWLDRGLDGFRCDAVPYLFEREGTNCENLPETHAFSKELRRQLDAEYTGKVLLAEANQWPNDLLPYFGNGNEFHMAFNFPLMPRIFMSVRLEDCTPIKEVMEGMPAIPEGCQWGVFLRNHDELTLEMVTNEERAYMYSQYAPDPRMKINVGIRRRLAPLLDNDRRKIELLNSLLFTLPGTPVIYYGDEIGMGDNIWLNDRDGVRTPMQWSATPNGGFSEADDEKLYAPVISDPTYGFEAVNVETQRGQEGSLLEWMKKVIAVRKGHPVFGRGDVRFIETESKAVIAYARAYEGRDYLFMHNLSASSQSVELGLRRDGEFTLVDMLNKTSVLASGMSPHSITLQPHGYLWLHLH